MREASTTNSKNDVPSRDANIYLKNDAIPRHRIKGEVNNKYKWSLSGTLSCQLDRGETNH